MQRKSKIPTLYYRRTCPYCRKVLRAAAELDADIELIETTEQPWARQMLLERRGRATVPVLGIPTDDGEHLLPESDDIIAYLNKRAGLIHELAA